jgi:hypothetical protein
MGYADYHARDWAENQTDVEIGREIARLRAGVDHPWNSVGCAYFDEVRMRTLIAILDTRKGLAIGSGEGDI